MAGLCILLLAVWVAAAAGAPPPPRDPGVLLADGADHRSLQFLLKDRQGAAFERPYPVLRPSFEKRHQAQSVYRHDHQWYADPGDSREGQEAHEGYEESDTYLDPPTVRQYVYEDSPQVAGDAGHADDRDSGTPSFTGSHVARHPLFEETHSSFSAETSPSHHDTFITSSQVIPPIPTKSPNKKASPFGGFSPFPKSRPSPATVTKTAASGEDRDDFLHHTNSYSDDTTPYHEPITHHEPAKYHEPTTYHEPASYDESDNSLLGHFKKYGGAMAPLLLASGLLFLIPSVQTITSTGTTTSRRRRRRELEAPAGEDAAERTLLLVERLQTLYSSVDEDAPCASRLFCQLGDVIADSDSPARVIKYMSQFFSSEDVNMKIMKKAAHAEDPKCHLYVCDAVTDAVAATEAE